MIINKKSWHYRYITTLYSEYVVKDCTNLCGYIRKFVGTTILYVMFTIFIATFGGAITGAYLNLPGKVVAWSCLPVGALTVGVLLCLTYLVYKIDEWRVKRKSKKNVEKLKSGVKVEPSPFVQYVKDKHNKMCSFIEFEE